MVSKNVSIRDDSIRLGQFIKLADAVDQGSDVKMLLAAGDVSVNGEMETRRGRQLRVGDEVGVHATTYRVTAGQDDKTDSGR
ncbi:MAG: RNA-binding S4 domain-containing protein [Actinomycetota bacterium]|jgi:ribosome-associated protein|nr:RNA-binding S4 domain-containing protein [Actinomycetota bacterium]